MSPWNAEAMFTHVSSARLFGNRFTLSLLVSCSLSYSLCLLFLPVSVCLSLSLSFRFRFAFEVTRRKPVNGGSLYTSCAWCEGA